MSMIFTPISDLLQAWFAGVADALRIHQALVFYLSSSTIRLKSLQCFFLNGLIFVGSILFQDYILSPLLKAIAISSNDAELQPVSETMELLFSLMYKILWIYPLYSISFILNAIWYQDIADFAYMIKSGVRPNTSFTFQRWLQSMAEEVYRTLLITCFMVQVFVMSFIPVVGKFLAGLHFCWLYALYSFEYKWTLERWSLLARLQFFEDRWAYFAGFGFPAAVVTFAFPKFISAGLFAFSFPMFVLLAIVAVPVEHTTTTTTTTTAFSTAATAKAQPAQTPSPANVASSWGWRSLPVFWLATKLSSAVLSWLQRCRSKQALVYPFLVSRSWRFSLSRSLPCEWQGRSRSGR